ncbi:contractile injection system tape measure protein [Algoriphagus aquimarinus]|uniref:contractile injection system tape measure protein n=1 Tax=Algoriphagus aquimarinus TaxID=237018 RepID=UPI0030DD9D5A|tara:strand:- start:191465 stop:191974 length:510 start_codon:yes stop_codon:yes gene_type:complete
MNQGIALPNAGLVLLNSFFPTLFERLGLIQNGKFIDEYSQSDAVQYLQFLATGNSGAEETFLSLNKILCGVPISSPLKTSISITPEYSELIDGLIKAAIGHWPAIGDTSVDGFRGNWLVRDGILIEHQDHWVLMVEKKAYDILISKAPFSFSIIMFPWMEKPIHVDWPY